MKIKLIHYKGFTMLEVIVVVLLIGILSSFIIGRSMDNYAELISEAETLKAHLRYAQYLSLVNDVNFWGINLNANSYSFERNGAATNVFLPGENSPVHTITSGIVVSSGIGHISFDNWGSTGTSNTVITLSSSSNNYQVIITKNTGFIE
ncbi:MAG: type II secretion system protein [Desulfobacterales bacterium]|nr:type II secretion system protein [Desulfobacterales bacterium]